MQDICCMQRQHHHTTPDTQNGGADMIKRSIVSLKDLAQLTADTADAVTLARLRSTRASGEWW